MSKKENLRLGFDLLKSLGTLDEIKDRFDHNFADCTAEGCAKKSMGVMCARCKQHVCFDHGFLRLTVPPTPICKSCVGKGSEHVDEHR
jgi:hypothetical protein